MSGFDFDELDPCCQKDIMAARKEAYIKEKLSGSDVSAVRLKTLRSVLTSEQILKQSKYDCLCCKNEVSKYLDYPLMASLCDQNGVEKRNIDDSDVSDNESDDEFLTEYQQRRKAEFQQHFRKIENAKLRGFGYFNEETSNHLVSIMKNITGEYGLVLFLYHPHSLFCARLNNVFKSLSPAFLGTIFRRMDIFSNESENFIQYLNSASTSGFIHSNITNINTDKSPVLLCFRNGCLAAHLKDLSQFGNDDAIYVSEVKKYIDYAGVLFEDTPDFNFNHSSDLQGDLDSDSGALTQEGGTDTNNEDVAYCDRLGCGRNFPHTHVGVNSEGGSGILISEAQEGSEALGRSSLLNI